MRYSSRSQMLAEESIGPLLTRLSLPAMVSMMVQALYNVVDTIFIGQWVGTLGISAITVVLPIHMLMMAVGQTIGVGGASIISRRMGAGGKRCSSLDPWQHGAAGRFVRQYLCRFRLFLHGATAAFVRRYTGHPWP